MPEPEEPKPDPSDESFIRKVAHVARTPLFDKAIYALVAAALGGTASIATSARDTKAVHENRDEIVTIQAELDRRAKALHDRISKEEAEREKLERERIATERALERALERRFARIEARLGIEPPAASAER